MGRNLDPKCKQCRRLGEKLFLKGDRCNSPKCAMIKRNYPPGIHGQKGYRRLSSYGIQLKEKQKARKIYGLNEAQFRRVFEKASKKKGDTGEIMLQLLEMRLDSVVYRLGFGSSRDQARQLVNHGAFLVNGKKVDIPSYQSRVGEVIRIRPENLTKKYFIDLKKSIIKQTVPPWLKLDKKELPGEIIALPKRADMGSGIQTELIVELYSR
jgi:small subunit ribosomal protein S4